jgi:DNA invertase Pin-like site-specific DNA recombinase
MRTREGMKVAKAKGRLRGKQPKLSTKQEAHLVALHQAGEHTIGELEELFSITRSTVYRTIARDRVRMAPTFGREAAMPAPAQGAGQEPR